MVKQGLIIFLWVAATALISCSKQVTPDNAQIIGLASPVQLEFDTTRIMLSDFFLEPDKVSDIKVPEGLAVDRKEGDRLILTGSLSAPLDVLNIEAEGIVYSLLVKQSGKQLVDFTFDPQGRKYGIVQLKGEMNAWNPASTSLEFDGAVWSTSMLISEGIYQYLFVADGEEILDSGNPESVSNGMGGRNSLLRVGEKQNSPKLFTKSAEANTVVFQSRDVDDVIVFWQNQQLQVSRNGDLFSISIPEAAAGFDRSFIRAWAYDSAAVSNDVLIPLQSGQVVHTSEQLTRHDFRTWNMYFVLIDRFKDGNPDNTRKIDDRDIHPKANYYGGDFAGITQAIQNGYFDKIGVNTLWLSPITQNPEGAYGLWDQGGPVTKFSGYHGYWPVSSSKTDDRFGTEEEFRELLDIAHSNGMNVILDYVANHVHELHPVYQEHPEWATDLYLPDGRLNTELWDEQRLTTWFDTFMPTLDFSRKEVIETMTDSALYWVKEFDLDGFRHDATKHIQLEFWRTLTRKVKDEVTVPTAKQVFQIGETYGSRELIASYINSGMLHGQFDFNMYDAAVNAFGQNGSFEGLRDQLQESFNYYGYHNMMGYISGNHDKARFITYTSGEVDWSEDAKLAGWTREIGYPQDFAYDKLSMLHAWNLTIPGIPVTYYGDEFGMPGANDPDNRRWMRFDEEELRPQEFRNRNIFTKLTKLRNTQLSLLYGDFIFHHTGKHTLVYSRAYFGEQVVVVFNKSDQPQQIHSPLREGVEYSGLEAQFGHKFEIRDGKLLISLPADSFEILTF